MTPGQVKGRRITRVIACWVCLPSVSLLLMLPIAGYSLSTAGILFRLVVPPVLSWFVLRRSAWARYLLVVLLALVASLILLRLVLETRGPWWDSFVGGMVAVVHVVAATTLYASKSVDAFFRGPDGDAN